MFPSALFRVKTLTEKERNRWNVRGIFTVFQLSYTFRAPRRSARALPKHQPALKAIAIRKNQIHILGTPTVLGSRTPADHLQLFHDWAASFVLLVSCPALVILMVTDDSVLATSLKRVQQNGAVQIVNTGRVQRLPTVGPLHLTFGKPNLVSYLVGLVVGLFLGWKTIQIYTPPRLVLD